MPPKFIRNLVVAFVVILAFTLLYHEVLLGSQYDARLGSVTDIVDGQAQSFVPALLIGVLLTALGYAWFVPSVATGDRRFLLHGAVMGMNTLGTFTFMARGLMTGWTNWLTVSDFIFGILSGLLMGAVFMWLYRPKTA